MLVQRGERWEKRPISGEGSFAGAPGARDSDGYPADALSATPGSSKPPSTR